MRKLLTILLCVSLLTLTIFSFVACSKEDEETQLPEGTNMSIMSYNIRQDIITDSGNKDWGNRKAFWLEQVNRLAPSILCMQEVKENQADDIKNGLNGYEMILYSRTVDKSEEGLAIAYKGDQYELVSKDMFWLSETPNVESKGFKATYLRICVHAILKEISTQREISVYCVHLEVTRESSRDKEMEMILDIMAKDNKPKFICGDFNTTYDSDCFRRISSVMHSAQDTALTTEEGMTYQDFGGALAIEDSIDFIFLDDNFFAVDFDIVDESSELNGKPIYYSDHYPVLSNVIFKS